MIRHRFGIRRFNDDPTWNTVQSTRFRILVITRTRTSTYRILEALSWMRDDLTIEFVCTIDDNSAFSDGVHAIVRDAGLTLIPWEQAIDRRYRYHLAVTASENVAFDKIHAPTIVLTHGTGFNKFVSTGSDSRPRLSGLPSARALRAGSVTIALSHPDQHAQLRAADRRVDGRTELVGDATFDRLRASRPLRHRYRTALGTGERTLVALASTWGKHSLYGRLPTLAGRLLAALPADSYQVVMMLHPNVWVRHSGHEIARWSASARAAGLILVPPESGWQAALIAADQVISDHGSLALFAASQDVPLLTTGPCPETVPGTPATELARCATLLDPDGDLRGQLDEARARFRPGSFEHIIDRVFTDAGNAAENIRNLIYRKLGATPPPDAVPITRVPIPVIEVPRVTSFVVHAATNTDDTVELTRIPAAVRRGGDGSDAPATHIVADETELDQKIVERAAAITSELGFTEDDARRWARSMLGFYPGARLAVAPTPHGWLAICRDGTELGVGLVTGTGQVQLVASALYRCLLERTLPDRPLTIRAGSTVFEVRISADRVADRAHRSAPRPVRNRVRDEH